MPINLGQGNVDRGQFVGPQQVGDIMRMMLVDEYQRDRTKMGSDEKIITTRGTVSKELILTGVTLDGSTMGARKTGAPIPVGELQRIALKGLGFGAFIEASQAVNGRQVGDVITITVVSGTTWKPGAGGKFDGTATTDPTVIAAAKAADKLSWNYTVTIRRATPAEAAQVAHAEAEWARLNSKEPISLSAPTAPSYDDDEPF